MPKSCDKGANYMREQREEAQTIYCGKAMKTKGNGGGNRGIDTVVAGPHRLDR